MCSQTAPEIILYPRAASLNDTLPSLCVDPALLTAAVATELAAASARKKEQQEEKETPAFIRSKRLFNVQKLAAARAAAEAKGTNSAKREKKEGHGRELRDSHVKEQKEKDNHKAKHSARKDKDNKDKDSKDKEKDKREHKERDHHRDGKETSREKDGKEHRDSHRESKESRENRESHERDRRGGSTVAPSREAQSPSAATHGASDGTEKLANSAPAGAAKLSVESTPPRSVSSSISSSSSATPTTASRGLQRRDTMTIMALEMSAPSIAAVAATTSTPTAKKGKGTNKEAFTESDMQAWLEEVLGTKVFQDGVSSAETLRDGIVLCKLLQALRPGSIKRYNAMKGAFFQLENITFFLTACTQHLGLARTDLFDVRDLYDQANFVKVLRTLELVHRAARLTATATATTTT